MPPVVRPTVSTRALLLGLLLLGACQRVPLGDLPADDDMTGSTSGPAQVTDGPADDGGGGLRFDCEPGDDRSCGPGEKCTAISDGGPQNHFICVPDDAAILPGDECTPAEGTGQDRCATGYACLRSQPGDALGRCFPLCRNNDDCEPGACETSPYTLTPFCADPCDPLAPACPPGLACRQTEDRFVCGMNIAEVDVGQSGELCDFSQRRGCAENLICMPYALVAGCSFSACCTTVCELDGLGPQCSAPALCRSPFAQPAPGFEALGACYVPQ